MQDKTHFQNIEQSEGCFFTPEGNISTGSAPAQAFRGNNKAATGRFSFYISTNLIEDNITGNRARALAFFYFLKHTFSNGRIYKTHDPIARMAMLAGVSSQTVYRWIRTLKAQGLITDDSNAYILAGNRQINQRYDIKNPERRRRRDRIRASSNSFKDIETLLMFKPFEKAAHKQVKAVELTDFLTDTQDGKNPHKRTGDTFRAALSLRHIAQLYNCSTTKARRLLKAWNDAGLIQTTVNRPVRAFRGIPEDAGNLQGMGTYHYYSKGFIYEIRPAFHELLTTPLKYREVTLNRYKTILQKKDPAQMQYVDRCRRQAQATHRILNTFS